MVRVRMFAALREAAGSGEVEVPAGTLGSVMAALEARYGAAFAEVLRHASVLVDGDRRDDPATPVPDGAEVALLPPFSGGAGTVEVLGGPPGGSELPPGTIGAGL